jgi:hypothetical protein
MKGHLYYSTRCEYCLNLMTIMENQGLIDMFTQHCVDNMSSNDIVKLGIRTVPTLLLINTQNGQQQKGIYENEKAFNWVESVVSNRRQQMIKQAENTRKLIQVNEMKKRMKEGLVGYCQSEVEGLSDSYAYWKDDMSKDIDSAQPKSYLPLGQDEQYSIMTIPIDKKSDYKLNKNTQKQLIKDLEKTRDTQDNEIKSMMEKEQIIKVINMKNQ